MLPTTPCTQALSSATCSTTRSVCCTRSFSRSSVFTREDRRPAVSAAEESMPVLTARVAITWEPRLARRRSRRPSSRDRSACEVRRVCRRVVRVLSRLCRVARVARTSARVEASWIEGVRGGEADELSVLLVLVLLLLLFSLSGCGCSCWAGKSPLGRLVADIGTLVVGGA
ncbi:hypothetical protein F5B20DRAFT_559027 [Whalleya microplaca]|nr:hypothetical protein F5B20DRAFT_559027 [Whalleya microplaca]